jgi:hypothetical protein
MAAWKGKVAGVISLLAVLAVIQVKSRLSCVLGASEALSPLWNVDGKKQGVVVWAEISCSRVVG